MGSEDAEGWPLVPPAGVQSAAVNVICELARRNPKNYLSLAPLFFKLMTSSTNNWVLIKIIKLASTGVLGGWARVGVPGRGQGACSESGAGLGSGVLGWGRGCRAGVRVLDQDLGLLGQGRGALSSMRAPVNPSSPCSSVL